MQNGDQVNEDLFVQQTKPWSMHTRRLTSVMDNSIQINRNRMSHFSNFQEYKDYVMKLNRQTSYEVDERNTENLDKY